MTYIARRNSRKAHIIVAKNGKRPFRRDRNR
jgi:hypothetical protein